MGDFRDFLYELLLENIDTLAIRGDPEGRPATPPTFVAAVEHSLVAKVIITNKMFSCSADGTGLSHFGFQESHWSVKIRRIIIKHHWS
jgi:hypothetical protein